MSQFGLILRESETGTILRLLRERMEGVDGERPRRRSFKERLRLKSMGCCGATWGFGFAAVNVRDDDAEEINHRQEETAVISPREVSPENTLDPGCENPAPVSTGMNLAAALAAERCFWAAEGDSAGGSGIGGSLVGRESASGGGTATAPGTPSRVSLMRLLEEADCGDEAAEAEKRSDSVCCVCMTRKKGAAFIPCGHTYCRVCSRDLWLNRGSCPLCNRPILEILDIF